MKPTVCVAFQGGGSLGLAHLGAWKVLAERFGVVGTAGTSAGAIVAALCAAGYTPSHAIDLFLELNWPEFVTQQSWLALVRKRDGWSDGERFYEWLGSRIGACLSRAAKNITFGDLYSQTGVYLAIAACDLNGSDACPVVFDRHLEPETSVAFAVRASISIPGVFSPVPRRDRGQLLVDGGLLLNFPARLVRPLALESDSTLVGVRFDRPSSHLTSPSVVTVLKRSLARSLSAGNGPGDEMIQDPNYLDIVIDSVGFDSLDFKLSRSKKEQLLMRGEVAAERALDRFDLKSGALQAAPGRGGTIGTRESREGASDDSSTGMTTRRSVAKSPDVTNMSTTASDSVSRVQLRRIMVELFNEAELREIVFDLGIDYEGLAGDSKGRKVTELVLYVERHGRYQEVIDECRRRRPSAF
jgi:predicted acylesterase/phospholipase RssA